MICLRQWILMISWHHRQSFPEADFFTEFERFDRHVYKLRRSGAAIDYVSIASPNYLHDSHMRFALRSGADAICEKPLVLNPWNIDALKDIEAETGNKINTICNYVYILQLFSYAKKCNPVIGPQNMMWT